MSAIIPIHRRLDIQALLPAAILPFWLCVLGPWWRVYEFHPDEGVNLMKAALVANGYHLYDQIWNDQPPILTLILAATHWLFPYDVGVARAVVLGLFSASSTGAMESSLLGRLSRRSGCRPFSCF